MATLSKRDRFFLKGSKCGIGILLIFNKVFRYLQTFLVVLQYWVPCNVPLINFDI